jgi:alcohol dehydrogenase class IV
MMQQFQLSTELCFGEDALECLERFRGQRMLLVTDPFFAENGTAQRVCVLCRGESRIFAKVRPDPPLELVAEGAAHMEEFDPEVLIALGGGSAIDCAKGMLSIARSRPFFVAIPTTSGTGSEVTSFAVLTHQGVKLPLIDPDLRPNLAILDDSLLQKLPKQLIADAGMDVIAHCVEALVAKNRSLFTQGLAVKAYQTVMELLPRSYEGDSSVRGQIHCAATIAGIAFDQAGLGACHALSHAIGGKFHLAHGKLNAVLLPHVIQLNSSCCSYSPLGNNPVFAVTRLRRRLQLPDSLTAAGLNRGELLSSADELCSAALADPCNEGNPYPMTKDAYHRLLNACL